MIKDACDEHLNIHALGSGHSWSTITISDGVMLSLYHYHKLVNHDKEKKQVTLQWRLHGGDRDECYTEWTRRSISDQTIAGSIATGMLLL